MITAVSSGVVAESSVATGASFTALTVIVTVAESVNPGLHLGLCMRMNRNFR